MSLEAALKELAALKPGEQFSYTAIAKKYGVVRSTLTRRHKAISTDAATKTINQQQLTPQQEQELLKYIEILNTRRLPPTREMIRNFASSVAQNEVSESWVTRFINKYSNKLICQYSTGMDSKRHNADSYTKYELYFNLLQHKIAEYNVKPRHTYNIDEKGFMMRVTTRTKHVFSRRMWEKKEVRASLQDGNRAWVTLLACVCADGSALPPGLIYESANNTI